MMTRALWFMLKVAVVVAAAVWLADNPGTVSVVWQGYVVETSFSMMALAVAVLIVASAALYQFWRGARGLPRALRRSADRRRRDRGYRALTQGMVAVAAGDAATAKKMAQRADGLLNEPPLTMLLSAQAAQLGGDDRAAKRYFTQMLERPETAFLGLRGLLTQAIRIDDRVEALALARRARALQPNTPWLLATLYDLEARSGDWTSAEKTLHDGVQNGAVKPEDARHHRAALLLERSFEAERRGRRGDAALTHAQAAHDLLPGFAPAAERLARLLLAAGEHKRAAKAIQRTWRISPHPQLADAYREVVDSYDPLARVKLFEKLAGLAPNHIESRVALARAALDAKLWGEARKHLNRALEIHPSRRIYTLLAELERAEHGDGEAAHAWLAKAAQAPADPAWTCRTCGSVSADWAGLCGGCGGFDTLDWRTPKVALHLATPDAAITLPAAAALPTVIEATR